MNRRGLLLSLIGSCLCAPALAGGIMFSGAADLGNNSGSSANLSASYTVGTGNNRALIACVFDAHVTSGAPAFTVTYDGVAMTGPVASDFPQEIMFFYLLNPASGSKTLSVIDNIGPEFIQVIAADYSNVRQAGQPDGTPSSVDDVSANDTFSGSYSTTANAATVIGCASNSGNGTAPTVSGSFTRRTYAVQFGDTLLADTGPVAPSGSVTLTATIHNGGFNQGQSFLSLIPAPNGSSLLLNGVGN